ncbi:DUF4231 domain-containing protein [Nocardia amamiensis]|uniref:DUF4231 domain-containing protein n=1 Tax=Nocardia amamiensis TaxID=404578 RepID=A0ABS0CWB6_9NOCA|nr:DUF4231 domain-containing protein [Nocardia amamiensis]MBF6300895.1 DUF4231 domain-containing protein [Nocardia amamiensis]
MTGLSDLDLPAFCRGADISSLRGQRLTLRLNRLRLGGSVLGALGGALTWKAGTIDVWAAVGLLGFAAALSAEIVLSSARPENDWYAGRALAESAKALAWRYAVGGEPFHIAIAHAEARTTMRNRLAVLAAEFGNRIPVGTGDAVITPAMNALRRAPFPDRRSAYIENRAEDQRQWYARKAEQARTTVSRWQAALVLAEVTGLVAAGLRAFGVWDIDWSGVIAACIAAGTAWMGLRQYSRLNSAYSTAANELALQSDKLTDVSEEEWPRAVADVEEAISREHAVWLSAKVLNLV